MAPQRNIRQIPLSRSPIIPTPSAKQRPITPRSNRRTPILRENYALRGSTNIEIDLHNLPPLPSCSTRTPTPRKSRVSKGYQTPLLPQNQTTESRSVMPSRNGRAGGLLADPEGSPTPSRSTIKPRDFDVFGPTNVDKTLSNSPTIETPNNGRARVRVQLSTTKTPTPPLPDASTEWAKGQRAQKELDRLLKEQEEQRRVDDDAASRSQVIAQASRRAVLVRAEQIRAKLKR